MEIETDINRIEKLARLWERIIGRRHATHRGQQAARGSLGKARQNAVIAGLGALLRFIPQIFFEASRSIKTPLLSNIILWF